MSENSEVPAQIPISEMTRPPGDKKNIQSPLDLSRVPSFCTSRAMALRWGAQPCATRWSRYYGLWPWSEVTSRAMALRWGAQPCATRWSRYYDLWPWSEVTSRAMALRWGRATVRDALVALLRPLAVE